MKILLFIVCVFIMTSLVAQPAIVGKIYEAHLESICEEVVGDTSCTGQEIYMQLYFEKDEVSVIEISVYSCGERTSEMIDGFPWYWAKNKHWVIVLGDLERTKYTIIENMRFIIRDGRLIGEKLDDKGYVVKEYVFEKVLNN